MFVLLLVATIAGKQMQMVYAPMGVTEQFDTFMQCQERAKVEMERVKHLVKGEYTLSCIPRELVKE